MFLMVEIFSATYDSDGKLDQIDINNIIVPLIDDLQSISQKSNRVLDIGMKLYPASNDEFILVAKDERRIVIGDAEAVTIIISEEHSFDISVKRYSQHIEVLITKDTRESKFAIPLTRNTQAFDQLLSPEDWRFANPNDVVTYKRGYPKDFSEDLLEG